MCRTRANNYYFIIEDFFTAHQVTRIEETIKGLRTRALPRLSFPRPYFCGLSYIFFFYYFFTRERHNIYDKKNYIRAVRYKYTYRACGTCRRYVPRGRNEEIKFLRGIWKQCFYCVWKTIPKRVQIYCVSLNLNTFSYLKEMLVKHNKKSRIVYKRFKRKQDKHICCEVKIFFWDLKDPEIWLNYLTATHPFPSNHLAPHLSRLGNFSSPNFVCKD